MCQNKIRKIQGSKGGKSLTEDNYEKLKDVIFLIWRHKKNYIACANFISIGVSMRYLYLYLYIFFFLGKTDRIDNYKKGLAEETGDATTA